MRKEVELNSQLMIGTIRHRRFRPLTHTLSSSLFMPYIDLDEIEHLSKTIWGFGERWWHWARFKRSDYVGGGDIKQSIMDKVTSLGGEHLSNPKVMALIHLRYLGVYFSPVNFYYIFDGNGEWRYLLAEVSNTPWNQTHYYLVPVYDGAIDDYEHNKAFHVSPFNPINQRYLWRVKPVIRKLFVHLECHKDEKVFDATLVMKMSSLSSKSLVLSLLKTPIMAIKVISSIYWHALVLWWKGAPIYDHTTKTDSQSN
ncbi:DUF1365 domain-containing protein [Vibrio sp. WJH972]